MTKNENVSTENVLSRFEEGKPADPTEHMSPEDAAEWKRKHQEHKDNFKSAAERIAARFLIALRNRIATRFASFGARDLREMEELMENHGYDPKDAKKLQDEGMGSYELEHRLKTTRPGGMGSLEYTHRIHQVK